MDLYFNVKTTYHLDNTHDDTIFKDPMNHFLVKVEECVSDFEAIPYVNYQRGCYMEKARVMYLVVEDPIVVDVLGSVV